MGYPATNVLSSKDVNSNMANTNNNTITNEDGAITKPGMKSLEWHRQMLQSKMEAEKYDITTTKTKTSNGSMTIGIPVPATSQRVHHLRFLPADPGAVPSGNNRMKQYTSPSDDIMSPCSAKLNALKSRQVGKAKPKSLFAQASAKKLDGENVLGAKSISRSPSPPSAPPQGDASGNDNNNNTKNNPFGN
ncbi:hypothetical protein F4809DRAFT_622416 [Biscogniauxia mediterranea]|nr:hypothetical protein F4809DRAFT_622416 [Biscogniauxia mediterranea]